MTNAFHINLCPGILAFHHLKVARVKPSRQSVVGTEAGPYRNFVGHGKNFPFHSKCDGKPLVNFEQSDTV